VKINSITPRTVSGSFLRGAGSIFNIFGTAVLPAAVKMISDWRAVRQDWTLVGNSFKNIISYGN
jgi:hypothetical protein